MPTRKTPQLDRVAGLLHGKPCKMGIAIAHAPPAPLSQQLGSPWAPAPPVVLRAENKAQFMDPQHRGFDTLRAPQRSAIARPLANLGSLAAAPSVGEEASKVRTSNALN